MLDTLSNVFAELAQDGRLHVADPPLAARQFAWLIVGEPLDRGMFNPVEELPGPAELNGVADAAAKVFLAAYGPRPHRA